VKPIQSSRATEFSQLSDSAETVTNLKMESEMDYSLRFPTVCNATTAWRLVSGGGLMMWLWNRSQIIPTVFLAGLLASTSIPTIAQTNAQERAASLRTQLVDVERKQTEVESRLRDLEEDLKPENIERSLAGVGSTHPEKQREQRSRELEIQKKGLQSQLNQLAASHTRLEKAITEADTQAYQQSASPNQSFQPSQNVSPNRSAGPQEAVPVSASPEQHRRKVRKTKHNARKRVTNH